MKLLKSIQERIATVISTRITPKLLGHNPLRGKEVPIIKATSIKEAREGVRFAFEVTRPLSLTSKANIDKANEALKALKAKNIYKKH